MKSIATKTGWGVMLFLALAITLVAAVPYLTLNPDVYFEEQRAVYVVHTVGIVAHVAGSILALALGPFQFLPALRRRWLHVHRWIGRIYLAGIAVGGIFGFYMAWLAYGGPITRVGFATLAILWLYTGAMAYYTIRNKEIQAHRRWVIRNYALTFAAVTLRLWLVIFIIAELDFIVAYRIVAWLAWVPNLLIVEWWIQQRLSPIRGKLQQATST